METIEDLESRLFYINMQDHLDHSDYKAMDEIRQKIKKLKGEKNGRE